MSKYDTCASVLWNSGSLNIILVVRFQTFLVWVFQYTGCIIFHFMLAIVVRVLSIFSIQAQCNGCIYCYALSSGKAGESWPVRGLTQTVVWRGLGTLLISSLHSQTLQFPPDVFLDFIWHFKEKKNLSFNRYLKKIQPTILEIYNQARQCVRWRKTIQIPFYFCFLEKKDYGEIVSFS